MQSRQIGELGVAVFGILLIGVVSLVATCTGRRPAAGGRPGAGSMSRQAAWTG